jgi:hypothetical protein
MEPSFFQGEWIMREWAGDVREPSLDEIFREPIIEALMRRDGVERRWVEQLLARIVRSDERMEAAAA